MMLLLAQTNTVPVAVTGNWAWGLAGFAVMLGGVFWCWNQIRQALGKSPSQTISPQPLAVEITKKLNEQFASKLEFENHREHTTKRHAQIFARIDLVERTAREDSDRRFAALNDERRITLDKLNDQFTFIREHIAAINRELQIRNK